MLPTIDVKTCPLCGEKNECKANSDEPCWCNDVTIPPTLLDFVPADLRDKVCICLSCIEKFNNSPGEFIANL